MRHEWGVCIAQQSHSHTETCMREQGFQGCRSVPRAPNKPPRGELATSWAISVLAVQLLNIFILPPPPPPRVPCSHQNQHLHQQRTGGPWGGCTHCQVQEAQAARPLQLLDHRWAHVFDISALNQCSTPLACVRASIWGCRHAMVLVAVA